MKHRIIRKAVAHAVAFTLAFSGTLPAWAAPAGGQVVAGSATISQSGTATTINQASHRAAINWQSFGIAANESVRFNQPSASAVALNRVLGQDPSQILGSLSANGQVFLLNPNGVLFGQGAQVNVGGLVASSLGLTNENFMAGRYAFERVGAAGSVVNQGAIRADGGVVAFLAPQVRNEGTITANAGAVALAAAEKVTLNLEGNRFLGLTVDRGALDALTENKGAIKADGGEVLLTAKAADALVKSVVNNEGTIEAQTLANVGGSIVLLAEGGETRVNGRLDASAPNGGDGGFVETSGDKVKIAPGAKITTAASQGRTGAWLVDPTDFTIAAAGGDIDGATLGTQLGANNVTLATAAAGAGNGDIFVNDTVTWANANTLTLSAHRNVDFTGGGLLNGGATGNVTLNAGLNGTSGAIIGHATNTVVTGNTLIANASSGIGSGATLLLTNVSQAALTNTQSGDIALLNGRDASGNGRDLTVAAAATNGHIGILASDALNGFGKAGGNITVGTVNGLAGVVTTDPGNTGLGNIGLIAGFGGSGGVGNGGSGGSINVNSALHAAQLVVLRAGSGGNSPLNTGGSGGSISVNAALHAGQRVELTAGTGGNSGGGTSHSLGGSGGSISVNATLHAGQRAALTAGSGGGASISTGGSGGSINLSAALNAGHDVTLTAGHSNSSALASNGGSITINSALNAGQNVTLRAGSSFSTVNGAHSSPSGGGGISLGTSASATLTAGGTISATGGNGGNGLSNNLSVGAGNGGNIVLGQVAFDTASATLTGGNGGNATSGSGGEAGALVVNAAVQFSGDAVLTVGTRGVVRLPADSQVVTGNSIDLSAAGSLAIVNATRIAPTGGNVSLKAGMNAGNTLALSSSLLNAGANNLTLQGHSITGLPASLTANALSITTAGGIGSAAMPQATSVNALAFQGSNLYVTNNRAATVNASSATGAFYLDNGANDVTLAGQVSAGGAGDAIGIAGRHFVNNAGASALSTPNGRWIVWSQAAASNTFGGLQSGNTALWNTAFNAASPTVAQAGNRYAFSSAQPVGQAIVKADDKSKTYGDLFTGFTFAAFDAGAGASYGNAFTDAGGTPTLVGAPVLSSAGAAATATRTGGNAGGASYDIGVDLTGVTAAGYTLQGVNGLLTVNPRSVSVAADGQSVTYGAAAAPLTYTATNLASFDTNASAFTGALARTAGANSGAGVERAGATAITQGSLAANANYTLTGFTGANYTIAPRALAVTASAQDKTYDSGTAATATLADNRLAGDVFTASGSAAFGDKTAAVGKSVTVSGIGLAGADAGNYAANTSTSATATINPRALNVSFAGVDKTYDASASATVTATDDRVAGDTLAINRSAAFANANAAPAKVVTVFGVSLGGTDATNYLLGTFNATSSATIAQRPLTITALDAAKLTTDPMPALAASLAGFAPGEAVASLTGLLTLTTPASASSPVGSYAIVPSGLSGSNYAIAYVNGKLTVVSPNDPQLQGALSGLLAGLSGTGGNPGGTSGTTSGSSTSGSGTGGTVILGGGMISIVTGDSADE